MKLILTAIILSIIIISLEGCKTVTKEDKQIKELFKGEVDRYGYRYDNIAPRTNQDQFYDNMAEMLKSGNIKGAVRYYNERDPELLQEDRE